MNIHPIIVHFPIAFLTSWALVELVIPKKRFPTIDWFSIQGTLLSVGFIGSLVALLTGNIARELIGGSPLIKTHATVATFTVWLFGIFFLEWTLTIFVKYIPKSPLDTSISIYLKLLRHPIIRSILVLATFIAIFLTGLLGGAIVYGTSTDPLAKIILPLFGIKL